MGMIDRRQRVDIHVYSQTGLSKQDLENEAKSLIEVRVLLPRIEGLGEISWTSFLLLIQILSTDRLLLSVPHSLIRVSFVNLLCFFLLLLSQLVGYSQCQDSLLNKVNFCPHVNHDPLCNVSLLLWVEKERGFVELALLQGLDVVL